MNMVRVMKKKRNLLETVKNTVSLSLLFYSV